MPLIRWLRATAVAGDVRREMSQYAECPPDRASQWQLDRFSRQWQLISARASHWAALKRERGLPDRFETWEQVCNGLPVLERTDLQTRKMQDLCVPGRDPDAWRATGGSTGRPVRIPVWRSETRVAAVDLWHARSWFGISPSDRAFLIWGHSHLLGHGVAGWIRGRVRSCKDRLLGYRRWSAYRMGDADLREAAEKLLRFQPAYMLGYAVALDRFARVNENRAPRLRALGLKAVIATGESFPRADSRTLLEEMFGCPVVMEYGAVETGPIAHERPGGGYQAFWRRYFVELLPSTVLPGSYELILTSLYPRCLPLIRYRIGDLILTEAPKRPLLDFRAVLGRCNDTLVLSHGHRVHSEGIAHAVRDAPVTGFQLLQQSEVDITLQYTADTALTETQAAEIRRKLESVDPALKTVTLERTEHLLQTVAGKTRTVCSLMNAR